MATWIGIGTADPNDDIKVGDHSVGIGTTSPADKLEVKGNLALIPSADAYPTLQVLDYSHNNVAINFDSYYRSGWKSSDSGSNFRIYKVGDSLRFSYASGVSQGSTISDWSSENNNCSIVINSSGNVGIGTTSPSGILDVEGGVATSGNGVGITLKAQDGAHSGITDGGKVIITGGAPYGGGINAPILLQSTGNGSVGVGVTGVTNNMKLEVAGNINVSSGSGYRVAATQVVGTQQSAIANVSATGTAQDGTARTAINSILAALRAHGLIAS